ncbi:MAG: MCP four helix bundle domain-containing protein, partial [Bdellovibrionales bacterium]|nr:MCP four helix bundle domain-containing protein [Bdellovibrionales bacterium]
MKSFSLKSKLLSLSVFLVTISIVIGGVSYWGLQKVIANYSTIADVNFPNTSATLEMYSNFRSSRIQALNIVSNHTTAEDKKSAVKRMEDNLKIDSKLDKEYRAVTFVDGEGEVYDAFRKYIDEGNVHFQALADLYKENKTDETTVSKMNELVYKSISAAGNKTREPIEKLKKFHFDAADVSKKLAKDSAQSATTLIVFLIVSLGSFGLIAAYLFSSVLMKSLKSISDILDDSSSQVSGAAGHIASAAEELSQAVTEQSSSLQETSSSVEELSSMVKVNTENAKNASANSTLSKDQAEKGRSVVEEMVKSMALINDSNNNIMNQINHSNEQMSEIVKVIQEIESKTKVINDIVFQTKLLSFNASVEAARAGEQGKGFAVVAEEVGNLAQMSGNAAKEISDMLSASMNKVESIVVDTKSKVDVLIADGKEKVKNGTRVAEECGDVLKEIVHNVTKVATMASEISVASDEQSRGIVEITKAMGQLDQVTHSNSATSDQAAHAAG